MTPAHKSKVDMLQIWATLRSMTEDPRADLSKNPRLMCCKFGCIPRSMSEEPRAALRKNPRLRCCKFGGIPRSMPRGPLLLPPAATSQGSMCCKIRTACAQCIEGPTSLDKCKRARTMCCKFGQPVLNAMKVLLTKCMVDVLQITGNPRSMLG